MNKLIGKKSVCILLIVLLAGLVGCSAPVEKKEDKQAVIIEEFNGLLAEKVGVSEIIRFIDENVELLPPEKAVVLIDGLEQRQKDSMSELEEKYYRSSIQSWSYEQYQEYADLKKIDELEDKQLKELLLETRDGGFKVETAEGSYFPIINYEFYKKYSSYMTQDFKEYIELMARESNAVPAKDAALVISWDEVLQRGLNQERFIQTYPDSTRVEQVKQLYKRYVSYIFSGLDNTPLFSYDTKTFKSEIKDSYLKVIEGEGDSQLRKDIADFLTVLEENNDRLTDEVKSYLEKVNS